MFYGRRVHKEQRTNHCESQVLLQYFFARSQKYALANSQRQRRWRPCADSWSRFWPRLVTLHLPRRPRGICGLSWRGRTRDRCPRSAWWFERCIFGWPEVFLVGRQTSDKLQPWCKASVNCDGVDVCWLQPLTFRVNVDRFCIFWVICERNPREARKEKLRYSVSE